MLSVLDLKSIVYERTNPYTRARNTRLVQEPYFTVSDGGRVFHLRGRTVMWSFLDSLYPKNPLPRGPVEDDLFAPTVDTPSMLFLFTDFAEEAVSFANRYLIIEHDDEGEVTLVRNLDQYLLSTDIEIIGGMLEASGFGVEYSPSVYIDSKGSHLRASLLSRMGAHTLRVIDLGALYYMSISGIDKAGHKYCLLPPRVVAKKTKRNLTAYLKEVQESFNIGVNFSDSVLLPPVDDTKYLLTRELDTLLYVRLRRCI